MCSVLEVSTAGFYLFIQRKPSARALEDQKLSELIRKLFEENRGTYGTPRLKVALAKEGFQVSRARIARLMKEMGLVAKASNTKRTSLSTRGHKKVRGSNLVQMKFETQHLNQVWLADMSEIKTQRGKLYLSSLLDMKSRYLLGWSIREDAKVEGPLGALRMALARRKGQNYRECIHHSDQGSVYTSQQYQEAIKAAGLLPSFSDVGKCFDNAPKESFFATLKVELELTSSSRDSIEETRRRLIDYIEVFYNRRRIHSSLDYLSPLEFERLYWLQHSH